MNARKSLPMGALFMALIVMLAVLGVGYALWSETLSFEGTVETGEVDVAFANITKTECVDVDGIEGCVLEDDFAQYEFDGKQDAANCYLDFDGLSDADSEGDDGEDSFFVEVKGMYPSWHCKLSFDVVSLGNVPVHLKLPQPLYDNPGWVTWEFGGCYIDGKQLHLNDSVSCNIDIHFTNLTAPPENSDPIPFGWTILAHQWNEEPVCEFSLTPTGASYAGLYGSTVTPVEANLADCSTVNALKIEKVQGFQVGQDQGSGAGWAGWSCLEPGYPNAIGGGTSPGDVYAEGIAEPGAPAIDGFNYPNYPHYVFPVGEEGYVVEADGPTPPTSIYAVCAP